MKNSIASKLIKSASNESIKLVSGGPLELISQNGDQASFLALGEFRLQINLHQFHVKMPIFRICTYSPSMSFSLHF